MARKVTLSKLPSASDLADYGLTQEDMQKIFGERTSYPVDETREEDDTGVCSIDKTGKSPRYPEGYMAVWFLDGYALPVEWFSITGDICPTSHG